MEDGRREKVKVKQLPVKDYPKLLKAMDDEIVLVAFFCGKERSWVEGLQVKSHVALLEEGFRVSEEFFLWSDRRWKTLTRS